MSGRGVDKVLGGRYRLEALIGRGGTSVVYRARDESLGRAVAVKVYSAESADLARQGGELHVLSTLDHHSLVHLLDAGTDVDDAGVATRYLVMALVTGPTLQARLTEGPISARHIGEIGYDIAEALEYIHAHGVVHRDIKPSNIMLVDYGNDAQRARAKLTDFGIALANELERITAHGATTGTAAYLSPEQVAGGAVDPASDVYALGLVLLECFTRTVEFPGSLVESALARLSRSPVVPESIPPHWRELLTAMTARDPSARPIGKDLVAILRHVVITDSARHKNEPTEPLFVVPGPRAPMPRPEALADAPDEVLQRATALAARLLSMPIAVVSIVDEGTTRLASYYGEEIEEIARTIDLSTAEAPLDEPFVIEDGRTDPRSQTSPLVTGPLGLRFYAGVPVKRSDGVPMGTLSVLGAIPGTVSDDDLASLEDIAALVGAHIERRPEPARPVTGELSATVAMSLDELRR